MAASAGLTAREIDVLRLLARGLSSKQIARDLVISPKTARNHIEHIYVKIGASNTRRRELGRRYEIGVGNIMWGNDFPHPEGTWPYTREFLKERFHDIPVDETELILGLNQVAFYGFDRERLQAIADRIGPTTTDLGQADTTDSARWEPYKKAGRPWLTGEEAGALLTDV